MDSSIFTEKLRKLSSLRCSYFKKILAETDLTKMEFEIFSYIYTETSKNKEVSASSIASAFEVSIPAVMHKLDALEEKKLVIKTVSSIDKRNKYFTLTEEAASRIKREYQTHQDMLNNYLSSLGEEQKNLEKLLDLTISFMEDYNA